MGSLISINKLLADLVRIPSINPRVKGARTSDNESGVAEYVERLLKSAHIDVEIQEVETGRCNIIGHLGKGKFARKDVILLSAHMDTYPANEAEFEPKIDKYYLYGRGSADAKGSLAAMLHAFLRSIDSDYRRETYMVASVDEEHGLLGARKLVSHGMAPDLAITGEPTNLIPIISQKGILRSRIRIFGSTSHAAYPNANNTIFSTQKLLENIRLFNTLLFSRHDNPVFPPASVTPTKIIGEGDMNITPSEVSIWFDARFLPDSSSCSFLQEFKDFLHKNIGFEYSFVIDDPFFTSPPNNCPMNTQIVAEFFEAIKAVNGRCNPETFSYGSEAGILAEFSKASLVFGPGDPKYSHKEGERISLEELENAARIYTTLLTKQ